MSARYVQVNIGEGDLDDDQWGKFEDETIIALRQSIRGVSDAGIEIHAGSAWWKGPTEESVHVSVVADVDTYTLRTKLEELKKKYNQDAIALIVGSDLI